MDCKIDDCDIVLPEDISEEISKIYLRLVMAERNKNLCVALHEVFQTRRFPLLYVLPRFDDIDINDIDIPVNVCSLIVNDNLYVGYP